MYSYQNSLDQIIPGSAGEEESWDWVAILDRSETENQRSVTRKVHVRAGRAVNSRCEKDFTQSWTVLEGSAELTVGWELKFLEFGDSVEIPANIWYSLRAEKDFWMIQVCTCAVGSAGGENEEPG